MKRISLALLWTATVALGAPAIFFTDLESGPKTGGPGNLGAPLSIFGKGFGAERGTSTVTIGGVEVASYLIWGQNNANHKALDMIVVQPGSKVTGGAIVVTVNGESSKEAFSFTVSNGKILYMAPNGKDGKCSEDSPCKSVLAAFGDKAKPGDLVLARGGTYEEGEIWIHEAGVSGKPGARKTLKAYPGETPIWNNNQRGMVADGSYLTFSGLHFRNGKTIGIPEHPDLATTPKANWIINTSVVGPIDYDGIGAHGDDHILAGNYVEVKSSTQGTQGHCYYVSFGNNTKILYNYGSGAPGYGLHLYDQPRQNKDFRRAMTNVLVEGNVMTASTRRAGMLMLIDDHGYGAPYGNYIENVIVRNNVFYANNQIGIIAGGGTGAMKNIQIVNNTIYENGMVGIYIAKGDGAKSGFEVKNNLIVQTNKSRCNDKECGGCCSWYELAHVIADPAPAGWAVIENNGYFPAKPLIYAMSGKRAGAMADAKAITGAIQFRNAAQGDFFVTGGAALDRGMALPAASRDFNGVARPLGAAPDLGAFESAGSGKAEVVPEEVVAPRLKEAPWAVLGDMWIPIAGVLLATLGLVVIVVKRMSSSGQTSRG